LKLKSLRLLPTLEAEKLEATAKRLKLKSLRLLPKLEAA